MTCPLLVAPNLPRPSEDFCVNASEHRISCCLVHVWKTNSNILWSLKTALVLLIHSSYQLIWEEQSGATLKPHFLTFIYFKNILSCSSAHSCSQSQAVRRGKTLHHLCFFKTCEYFPVDGDLLDQLPTLAQLRASEWRPTLVSWSNMKHVKCPKTTTWQNGFYHRTCLITSHFPLNICWTMIMIIP